MKIAIMFFGQLRWFDSFNEDFKKLSEEEKIKHRKEINHFTSEIWYGEVKGDNQIHRIKSPKGPRLKMNVEWDNEERTKRISSTFWSYQK